MYICVKFKFPSKILIFYLIEFSIIKIIKSHNSQTIGPGIMKPPTLDESMLMVPRAHTQFPLKF